jgi:hypothetical protein
MLDRPVYSVELVPMPRCDPPPKPRDLARLLKRLGRQFGLRCVSVEEVKPAGGRERQAERVSQTDAAAGPLPSPAAAKN